MRLTVPRQVGRRAVSLAAIGTLVTVVRRAARFRRLGRLAARGSTRRPAGVLVLARFFAR